MRFVAVDLRSIANIARLGFPIGLTFFLEIGVFSIIGLMIATLGNHAMAAHQIAYNVWDVVYMPLISVGSAMATRVGHAIGRGDHQRVMLSIKTGTAMTILVGLAATALLLSIPGLLIAAYTNDPSIQHLAARLIQLAALFIVIDSVQVAAAYCLRAFKDTRYPFLVMCLSYWLIALPLSWWLGLELAMTPEDGTADIWKALIVGICVATVLITRRLLLTLRKPFAAEAHDDIA